MSGSATISPSLVGDEAGGDAASSSSTPPSQPPPPQEPAAATPPSSSQTNVIPAPPFSCDISQGDMAGAIRGTASASATNETSTSSSSAMHNANNASSSTCSGGGAAVIGSKPTAHGGLTSVVLRMCTHCGRHVANRQKTMCGACLMGFAPDDPLTRTLYTRQLEPTVPKFFQIKQLFLSRWYSQGERKSAKVECLFGLFSPELFRHYSEYQGNVWLTRDYVNERRLFLLADFRCESVLKSLNYAEIRFTCDLDKCPLCKLLHTGEFPELRPGCVTLSYEPPHLSNTLAGGARQQQQQQPNSGGGNVDRRICVVCKVVVGRSAWSNKVGSELDPAQGDSLLVEIPGQNSELRVQSRHAAVPIYLLVYSNDVALEQQQQQQRGNGDNGEEDGTDVDADDGEGQDDNTQEGEAD
eukprot:PhM_4_TR14410/c0_g1_i1/m.72335